MCSHESPSGSSFCLKCGSALGQAYAPTQLPAQGLPAAAICAVCRGENPPGMKYCRSCGSALVSGGAARPGSVPGAVPASAVALGGPMPGMPSGPIGGPIGGFSAPGTTVGKAPPGGMIGRAAGIEPTIPPGPIGRLAPSGTIACPRCGTQTPSGFAYCQQCGVHLEAIVPTAIPGSGRAAGLAKLDGPIDPHAGTLAQDDGPALRGAAAVARLRAQAVWGTVVLVNRDGSDGPRFPLSSEYLIVGRTGADVAFDDDRFLAREHARIERGGDGAIVISPLDTLNGVFRKTDAPVDLTDGTMILVGREVLRFETIDPEELKLTPLVRHGVAVFGSPPREPWGRLLQIVPSGGYRDVRHLVGDEVVIGREEGDIVFRDDAFLSRRHAALTWNGQRAQVTDLGSSNGTFVRITGPTGLRHGDHIRLGDQLLRIELGR